LAEARAFFFFLFFFFIWNLNYNHSNLALEGSLYGITQLYREYTMDALLTDYEPYTKQAYTSQVPVTQLGI
jgi:hypothetical protein